MRVETASRRTLVVAALLLVAAAGLGYLAGREHPREHIEEVRCLSAGPTISCDLEDGWTVSIPRDIAWTDVRGRSHDGTRPDCLPLTGTGTEGPVRITWLPVEADGRSWRQVIAVSCLA